MIIVIVIVIIMIITYVPQGLLQSRKSFLSDGDSKEVICEE